MSLFNFKKKKINSKIPTKQAERLDYMTNNSAYNPDYERAGEITKTDKNKIYHPNMPGEKFAVEVDGDDIIVAVLPLHSEKKKDRTVLSNKRKVITNKPGVQHIDRKVVIKDYKHDMLKRENFVPTNKKLRSEELKKVKQICKTESNKDKTKAYKKAKRTS